ncbi:hypothetical protein [Marinobacter piscensis]|uniref:hypothetical protein n=1 Tax=Marinobacter piscensis TaxID=1562308 RepID=UPI0011A32367|nr:hypothetical protein [Marinobacter piscensis]
MESDCYKTVEDMLTLLEGDSVDIMDNEIEERIEFPIPVSSKEYLEFSEKDLLGKEKRNLVNALSNAKRALDCRIEEILYCIGMRAVSKKKKWNIPSKLGYLEGLGVITPRILSKLNKERNLIEHEFHFPEKNSVEDFVDVVSLFIESTKVFIANTPNDGCVVPEIGFDVNGFEFKIDREAPEIIVNDKTLVPNDAHYERFAAGYAKIILNRYT